MEFTGRVSRRNRVLRYKEFEVEKVSEFKYLGVTVQSNGDTAQHVRELMYKANKKAFLLRKTLAKQECSAYMIATLTKIMIQSTLSYGMANIDFNSK